MFVYDKEQTTLHSAWIQFMELSSFDINVTLSPMKLARSGDVKTQCYCGWISLALKTCQSIYIHINA